MRIDPNQPINWSTDPGASGSPFWQMDSAGWLRDEDENPAHISQGSVSWRTFIFIAVPVFILLVSIAAWGTLTALSR